MGLYLIGYYVVVVGKSWVMRMNYVLRIVFRIPIIGADTESQSGYMICIKS